MGMVTCRLAMVLELRDVFSVSQLLMVDDSEGEVEDIWPLTRRSRSGMLAVNNMALHKYTWLFVKALSLMIESRYFSFFADNEIEGRRDRGNSKGVVEVISTCQRMAAKNRLCRCCEAFLLSGFVVRPQHCCEVSDVGEGWRTRHNFS